MHELPILGIEDAVERDSFFAMPAFLSKALVGDVEKGFLEADHKVTNAEVNTPNSKITVSFDLASDL